MLLSFSVVVHFFSFTYDSIPVDISSTEESVVDLSCYSSDKKNCFSIRVGC